jgi:hypothetical protein
LIFQITQGECITDISSDIVEIFRIYASINYQGLKFSFIVLLLLSNTTLDLTYEVLGKMVEGEFVDMCTQKISAGFCTSAYYPICDIS